MSPRYVDEFLKRLERSSAREAPSLSMQAFAPVRALKGFDHFNVSFTRANAPDHSAVEYVA